MKLFPKHLKHFEINIWIEKNEFFKALKSCMKKIGESLQVVDGLVQWGKPFVNQGSIIGIFSGMLFEAFMKLFPKTKIFIRNILKLTSHFI